MGVQKQVIYVIVLLFLINFVCASSRVIPATDDSRLSVIMPSGLPDANEPMFLAVDHIFAGDDPIHYVIACNGECLLKINDHEESCTGICRGSFTPSKDILFNVSAANGSLQLKIPFSSPEYGIVTVFNSPALPPYGGTSLSPSGSATFDYE